MGPNPYHTARLRADDSVFSHEQWKFTNIGSIIGMMASAVLVARELTLENALHREIDGDWTPIDLALNKGPVITQQKGSGTEVLIAEATVCPDGSAFNYANCKIYAVTRSLSAAIQPTGFIPRNQLTRLLMDTRARTQVRRKRLRRPSQPSCALKSRCRHNIPVVPVARHARAKHPPTSRRSALSAGWLRLSSAKCTASPTNVPVANLRATLPSLDG